MIDGRQAQYYIELAQFYLQCANKNRSIAAQMQVRDNALSTAREIRDDVRRDLRSARFYKRAAVMAQS
jgi:hypothetical protein